MQVAVYPMQNFSLDVGNGEAQVIRGFDPF